MRPSILKRVVALVIDSILLGIVGYISGIFLEDFYVSLGKYGTLIGTMVATLYFSVCQSGIAGGQTLGKKLTGMKVTDIHGNYLTLEKSLLRSSILFVPIMNIELLSGGNAMLPILLLVLLSIFASFYLVLINASRRCLHDILVSSVVTNEDATTFEVDEANDRSTRKLIPIAIMALLMIGAGIYQVLSENTLGQLLMARSKMENLPGVISVNELKSSVTTHYSSDGPPITYSSIQVKVRISDKREVSNEDSKYFDAIYKMIREEVPESANVDKIIITIYYGYNIGIASKTLSMSRSFEDEPKEEAEEIQT